ncbi:GILT-like protein 1 [Dermatophagoides farinae]|uniref:DNA-directed RNA polymerases I and III subunit RPAC1 n=1 Tax=Dermatophagoides farinae TaxID=6954 RepID=A0A922ID72_DERFA|nr:DNA-directed RNA polymerases I and III subunit RPAC1 [Dermatophagoides farinae]
MLNNQVFLYSTFSMITLFICWSWTTAIEQHEQIINNNHSGNNSIKSKVKIDVYYETLCPDSIQFLLHQLVTNYDRIKEKVDLHMYPFGKAQFFESGNSYEFYCQHGPKECRGNMIHCCVLDQNSHDISFPFIKCMEKELYGLRRPDINVVSQKCANWTNIDWKYVDECASGNRGKQLLVEAGRKTKAIKPKISFVPTIIFNEKYSDRIQNQALYGDFVKLIENHYNKNNEHKSE